jgi:hypothetical protein
MYVKGGRVKRQSALLERGNVRLRLNAIAAALLVLSGMMEAQDAFVAPSFEVASVERSDPKEVGQAVQFPPGGRFTARNCMVSSLIKVVYELKDYQLVDAPKWISDWSYRYNVDAKAAGSANAEQVRLVAAKGGRKLQASESAGRGGIEAVAEGVSRGRNVTMESLVQMLTGIAGRPVVDKTGFASPFDFRLEWSENALRGDDSRPSIFVALQEQMGLKLEARKGPVEVLVVEQAEKPSAN